MKSTENGKNKIQTGKLISLLVVFFLLVSCSKSPDLDKSSLSVVRPPFLSPGDSVGVVAISSRITITQQEAESHLNVIRSWGLKIKLGEHLYDHSGGWFPASDEERAEDLQAMIDNDNIKAVIFFKGGYGSVRVLDYLNLNVLREKPKWLVGFSDLTTIHFALRKIGVESIHGTMPTVFLQNQTDYSAISMKNALFGYVYEYNIEPHRFNQYGTAVGSLVGGNLTLISALSGTNIDLDLDLPSVLLIEDTGESIYDIDRKMQQLLRSGKLNDVKAVLVGHFTNISGESTWQQTIYELINDYVKDLNIPVIFNFPAGHQQPNYSVYMGRMVTVEVNESGGRLIFM